MDFQVGDLISIVLGGTAAHLSVFVRMMHVDVVATTEKAICVKGDNGKTLWLPKKALVIGKHGNIQLAKWFVWNNYTQWFIENNSVVSGTY